MVRVCVLIANQSSPLLRRARFHCSDPEAVTRREERRRDSRVAGGRRPVK